MFGYAKLFRSRWWALVWAASIILVALDVSTTHVADSASTNRSIRAE